MWDKVISVLSSWPILGSLIIVAVVWLLHLLLIRRSKDMGASKRFPRQLAMLAVTGFSLVVLIIVATGNDKELRDQLLASLAVVFSAVLGLSSTTFITNAMAGLLLRLIRNFRTGDFIRVGDEFGRVTEQGLFHTEIQTEDRDLVTLPNLFVAANPVRVVRKSGTIVSITLSLGYDVGRSRVEGLLKKAAEEAALQEPFVHVVELGDYSISYRIFGFLPEVKHLCAARSNLRKAVLDCLHGAGIEIVSPAFLTRRDLGPDAKVIPARISVSKPSLDDEKEAEAIIFDKADEAEAKEGLHHEREQTTATIDELKKSRRSSEDDNERALIERQIEEAERRIEEIELELEQAEASGDPDSQDRD